LETCWVAGYREFKKKKKKKVGDKRRVSKRKWAKGGPEEDAQRTATVVLKIIQMYDTSISLHIYNPHTMSVYRRLRLSADLNLKKTVKSST
jgi:hypothetical protein